MATPPTSRERPPSDERRRRRYDGMDDLATTATPPDTVREDDRYRRPLPTRSKPVGLELGDRRAERRRDKYAGDDEDDYSAPKRPVASRRDRTSPPTKAGDPIEDLKPSRRTVKDRSPYDDEPPPPRRRGDRDRYAEAEADAPRRRERSRGDKYDRKPAAPRRSKYDRYPDDEDSGYDSPPKPRRRHARGGDDDAAAAAAAYERGYKSDGRPTRHRRTGDVDDPYYERGYRTDGRENARPPRRERERDRHHRDLADRRDRDRDRDRDGDYYRSSKPSKRSSSRRASGGRDRGGGGHGRSKKGLEDYMAQGQKAWKTAEPIAKPLLANLAKTYLEGGVKR